MLTTALQSANRTINEKSTAVKFEIKQKCGIKIKCRNEQLLQSVTHTHTHGPGRDTDAIETWWSTCWHNIYRWFQSHSRHWWWYSIPFNFHGPIYTFNKLSVEDCASVIDIAILTFLAEQSNINQLSFHVNENWEEKKSEQKTKRRQFRNILMRSAASLSAQHQYNVDELSLRYFCIATGSIGFFTFNWNVIVLRVFLSLLFV